MTTDPRDSGDASLPLSPVAPARKRRLLPGRWTWRFIVLVLLGVVGYRTWNIDPGVQHVTNFVGMSLSAAALWAWFSFASDYSRTLRFAAMAGLPLAIVALMALVRVERFRGDMGPEFAWRWSHRRDEQLNPALHVPDATPVDLATTTPQDFPQFLGPGRNSVVEGIRLQPDWKAHPPKEIWRRDIGAGWSAFAAVNGAAVTLEQRGKMELVTCYDIATGQPRWSQGIEARHTSVLGFIGPRSTPTIHEGRVYALGATGILRCLKGEDGSVLWTRDLFEEHGFTQAEAERAVAWGRANSPLCRNGLVMVPIGGKSGGPYVGLQAFDQLSGEPVWEGGSYQASYASPAYGKLRDVEQILSVNQDIVSAHDPATGSVLWEHPWPGKSNVDSNNSQPLTIDNQYVLLSKGYGGGAELLALSQEPDGSWTVESIWKNQAVLKTKFSNVSIRDGMAYGLDDGILTCVDLMTGERQWKKGRYQFGQSLLVGEHLLVLGEQGELALVEARPDRFHEVARIQALEGITWNNPCLYGDHLLLRNAEQAVCYRLETIQE